MTIEDVPAFNVTLFASKDTGLELDNVMVDDPREILTGVSCDVIDAHVTLKFPVENEPCKNSNPRKEPLIVSALPKVQPPPTPSKLSLVLVPKVTPFVVMVLPVLVDRNLILPEVPLTERLVAGNVMEPKQFKVELPIANVIVPSRPDAVKSLHTEFETVTVNAPVPVFELASKNTLSTDVGALAPPAPPEVSDQLVVLVVFQVPVPPRQYLSAIILSLLQ
jgi:hypothetical protein